MYSCKKRFRELTRAATHIQNSYRRHRALESVYQLKTQCIETEQALMFDYAASVIQRIFRGYHSRKYNHDFYARKKYLLHIQRKNEHRLERMQQYHMRLAAEHLKTQEETARQEFYKLASSLHHLTSTKAIPGVYEQLEMVSDFGKHSLKLMSK